jgi:hypothetical protein
MDNISVRTTIIIKFAYHTTHFNNNTTQEVIMEEESTSSSPATINAAKASCAVCGSQLHMTSTLIFCDMKKENDNNCLLTLHTQILILEHCPVHP